MTAVATTDNHQRITYKPQIKILENKSVYFP